MAWKHVYSMSLYVELHAFLWCVRTLLYGKAMRSGVTGLVLPINFLWACDFIGCFVGSYHNFGWEVVEGFLVRVKGGLMRADSGCTVVRWGVSVLFWAFACP